MKKFDENGLPVDGYNYYQHVVDEEDDNGEVVFQVEFDEPPKTVFDVDFDLNEMTDECTLV